MTARDKLERAGVTTTSTDEALLILARAVIKLPGFFDLKLDVRDPVLNLEAELSNMLEEDT